MAREFKIEMQTMFLKELGDIAFLKLFGDIDQRSLPVLDDTVERFCQKKIYRFIFDFSQTNSINSSGLGLFINIAHQINESGGSIQLIYVPDKIKILFDLLGLGSRLKISESKSQALDFFKDNI